MKIALDYDQTYSLDPVFWNRFIFSAHGSGHEVRIVTMRGRDLDRTKALIEVEEILPVIYTGGVAKKWFLTHFGGDFQPDVWIDDKPESILNNSSATPESLVEWRANRVG
jgi:hypothetical protein